MRVAAALLLSVALLAAGCKPAPKAPTIKEQEAARAAELDKRKGWDLMLTPERATGAANQLGFHPTPYAGVGAAYRTQGGPVMISSSFSKEPNKVSFTGEGSSAEKLDKIGFDLAIHSPKDARTARQRFALLVRDFLFQAKIDAKPIQDAIAAGTPGKGDLAGAYYQIVETPVDGIPHLTVTFTRTGAAAPDSKPQGN